MLIKQPTYKDFGEKFIVDSPLKYRVGDSIIVVPKGFITDFASIPAPFRNFIRVNGKHKMPAVLHDYMYFMGGAIGHLVYTRKQADKVFLMFMKEMGVGIIRRWAMYNAVRAFGWTFWRKRN